MTKYMRNYAHNRILGIHRRITNNMKKQGIKLYKQYFQKTKKHPTNHVFDASFSFSVK